MNLNIASLIDVVIAETDNNLSQAEKNVLVAVAIASPNNFYTIKGVFDQNKHALDNIQQFIGTGVGLVFANNHVTDVPTGVSLAEKAIADELCTAFKLPSADDEIIQVLLSVSFTHPITQAVTAALAVQTKAQADSSGQP